MCIRDRTYATYRALPPMKIRNIMPLYTSLSLIHILWVGYDGQPKSTQFGRKSQRLAIPLEPGFVHTVEPGIYLSLIHIYRLGNCP